MITSHDTPSSLTVSSALPASAARAETPDRVTCYPTANGWVLIVASTKRGTYVAEHRLRAARFQVIGHQVLIRMQQEALLYEDEHERDGPQLVTA